MSTRKLVDGAGREYANVGLSDDFFESLPRRSRRPIDKRRIKALFDAGAIVMTADEYGDDPRADEIVWRPKRRDPARH
jgi:hypothetical protein